MPLARGYYWQPGRLIFAKAHTLSPPWRRRCWPRIRSPAQYIVYRAKRSDRVKILVWDTSGLVLVWKQLQEGSFRWPPIMDGVMKLSPVEFAALFDGLDWTRVQTVKTILKPSVAA